LHSAHNGACIEPTAGTGALIGEAVRMLRPLWRDGYRYFKVGVLLDDLRDAQPNRAACSRPATRRGRRG
jgi:DNA polymerase V